MKRSFPPPSESEIRAGIFWITRCIALGPYADAACVRLALEHGRTHFLPLRRPEILAEP